MSVLSNSSRRILTSLGRNAAVLNQSCPSVASQLALSSQNQLSHSSLTTARTLSSDAKDDKESWLERFFSFDTTKTAHSAVVGSQNIIYRLVFVKTNPQYNDDYIKLGAKMLPKFSEPRDDCRLIGAWQTVVGHNEEIVHLWQYKKGYESIDEMGYDVFPDDKDYAEFKYKSRSMIKSTYSQIAMNMGYFEEPEERLEKHIYELRSYKLKPGSMIEWTNHWAKGIDFRKSDNQNVAGMFTHIGELNMVHHIWAYKSFQDRNRIRKNSWANSGWSQTVANTVPLIKNIKSRVMTALPYSWLK